MQLYTQRANTIYDVMFLRRTSFDFCDIFNVKLGHQKIQVHLTGVRRNILRACLNLFWSSVVRLEQAGAVVVTHLTVGPWSTSWGKILSELLASRSVKQQQCERFLRVDKKSQIANSLWSWSSSFISVATLSLGLECCSHIFREFSAVVYSQQEH